MPHVGKFCATKGVFSFAPYTIRSFAAYYAKLVICYSNKNTNLYDQTSSKNLLH